MKNKLILFFTLTIIIFSFAHYGKAASNKMEIFIFQSQSNCEHCSSALNYLNTLNKQNGDAFSFIVYDIYEKEDYMNKFRHFLNAYNIEDDDASIPLIVIGSQAIAGLEVQDISSAYNKCKTGTCPNPEEYMVENVDLKKLEKNNPQGTIKTEGFFAKNPLYYAWIVIVVIGAGSLFFLFAKKSN